MSEATPAPLEVPSLPVVTPAAEAAGAALESASEAFSEAASEAAPKKLWPWIIGGAALIGLILYLRSKRVQENPEPFETESPELESPRASEDAASAASVGIPSGTTVRSLGFAPGNVRSAFVSSQV